MSDTSQGPGWWLASDGKWYPPEQVPGPTEPVAPVVPPPAAVEPPPVAPVAPAPVAPVAATPPPVTPPVVPPPGGYVPPPQQGYVAPPPAPAKKGGNGCLKAFLIVFAILVVLGIGVFVLLGFVVKKGVDSVNDDIKAEQKVEARTGIKSNSFGFNANHPPQDDVFPDAMKCTTDSDGNMQATGTLTNHSSETSFYIITVVFKQNGAQVSDGVDTVSNVDAGGDATWTVNTATPAGTSFSCRISEVERSSALNDFVTTTTR